MDMTRYLKEYLTVTVLQAMGGEYEGIVADVNNELIRNRYSAQRSDEGVISFQDGKRLVLNKNMLRSCISWFGPDSKCWSGCRLRIFLREVKTVNRETGEPRVRLQRGISCEDPHARLPVREGAPARTFTHAVRDRVPGEDDAVWESVNGDNTELTAEQIFGQDRLVVPPTKVNISGDF